MPEPHVLASLLQAAARYWLVAASVAFGAALAARTGDVVEYRRPTIFSAATLHSSGTIKVSDTTVRFQAPHVEHGAYVSDPSTNYFTDLTVGPNGYLVGGAGDKFIVSGNFTNNSTRNMLWNTAAAELDFRGDAGPHAFALAGADVGASYFGYVDNFAWGTLRLAAGEGLTLGDGNTNNAGTAFYVGRLVLDGGIAQASSITGNGANLYYDPTDAGNAALLVGAPGGIYPLAGGGSILPVQAVLKILSITHLANGHVIIQCIGVPNRNVTVQATNNLASAPFTTLAVVRVDESGFFTYEDAGSQSLAARFYRLSFP